MYKNISYLRKIYNSFDKIDNGRHYRYHSFTCCLLCNAKNCSIIKIGPICFIYLVKSTTCLNMCKRFTVIHYFLKYNDSEIPGILESEIVSDYPAL